MNNEISWYISRLKAMSIPEIYYRLDKKNKSNKYKKKYLKNYYFDNGNNFLFSNSNINIFEKRLDLLFNCNSIDLNKYKVKNTHTIFGTDIDIMSKINWHMCSVSEWEKNIYSSNINFKSQDDIGDVRFTWEVNRHLFFPQLALNYKKTKDKKYVDILSNHINDWIKENPFLKGVNWSSPMEIAIRNFQWIITYALLKDEITYDLKKLMLNMIIESTIYVNQNYSLYSSANNHLIVEAIYCGIIGYLIEPLYKNSYLDDSVSIIEREIELQNYSDGVNKEQATHYQAFVIDAILQFLFFLNKLDITFSNDRILFEMCKYMHVLNKSGNMIEYGDSDDAKLISFNIMTKDYYDYVLQLASIYFGYEFIDCYELFEEVKFISSVIKVDSLKTIKEEEIYMYEEGGYFIFNINKHFMLFDIGELGFSSIAAHGHADALSVIYSYDKKNIFIDPGTYIYNVESEFRDYFRKTSSHNAVSINNSEQSEIKGPFLWGKKSKTKLIDYGSDHEKIYISAINKTYEGKQHTRSITYLKNIDTFIICDECCENYKVNFTLDKMVNIKDISNKNIELNIDASTLYISFNDAYNHTLKWISKRFMSKEQTKGIFIENMGRTYSTISSNSVNINGDYIEVKGKKYKYNSYKSIKEVSDEK